MVVHRTKREIHEDERAGCRKLFDTEKPRETVTLRCVRNRVYGSWVAIGFAVFLAMRNNSNVVTDDFAS